MRPRHPGSPRAPSFAQHLIAELLPMLADIIGHYRAAAPRAGQSQRQAAAREQRGGNGSPPLREQALARPLQRNRPLWAAEGFSPV